jgi:hypothetical protein
MSAVRSISRLVVSTLGRLYRSIAWTNRLRMARWAAEVDRIVSSPPGSDDGFTREQIENYSRTDFSRLSTWAIVCEEVLDTTFPRSYFVCARAELRRRGISDNEYGELRRFAWLTAGWLNYEKMLWDWCSLDEDAIRRAIERQFKEGWISLDEHDRRLEFAGKYPVET